MLKQLKVVSLDNSAVLIISNTLLEVLPTVVFYSQIRLRNVSIPVWGDRDPGENEFHYIQSLHQ